MGLQLVEAMKAPIRLFRDCAEEGGWQGAWKLPQCRPEGHMTKIVVNMQSFFQQNQQSPRFCFVLQSGHSPLACEPHCQGGRMDRVLLLLTDPVIFRF